MKFVFCEGGDDEAVIKAIATSLNLEIAVERFRGKDNLRNLLREIGTRPEFAQKKVTSVAVIRDADDNPAAAFASVHDAFANNGFAAPSANQHIQDGHPRCGILILPLDRPGMIEDLCLESVSHEPEFRCVQDYFIVSKRTPNEPTSHQNTRCMSGWAHIPKPTSGSLPVKRSLPDSFPWTTSVLNHSEPS